MNDAIANFLGDWCRGFNLGGVALKIGLSVLLATLVGCERATKRHAAGLRTFILVALVATLAAMVDNYLVTVVGAGVSVVIGATIIGIAIVSSNTILYSSKSQIKGLTTSVALWGICLVGVLIGLDLYAAALIAFVAYMICLTLFMSVEYAFKRRSNHFEIHLELNGKESLRDFIAAVRMLGLKVDDIEFNAAYQNTGLSVYTVALTIKSGSFKKFVRHDDIIAAVQQLEYVNFVEELD